jgi:hypothetical protein
MNTETYDLKMAMKRLGLQSANAFFQLERKYPMAFVIMKRKFSKDPKNREGVLYDKATLDRFAESREYFKQDLP